MIWSFTALVVFGIALAGITAWCAAATVGIVSVLAHQRKHPDTPGEWALWACRGIAYATGAGVAGLIGLYAAFGLSSPSLFGVVIIAFALVALRMRHEHHGTGGKDAT